MGKRRKQRRSAHRAKVTVMYGWSKPDGDFLVQDIFDLSAMEQLLQHGKDTGIVYLFDTGRGDIVWFEGAPGAALRELRKRVLALLPVDVVPLWRE